MKENEEEEEVKNMTVKSMKKTQGKRTRKQTGKREKRRERIAEENEGEKDISRKATIQVKSNTGREQGSNKKDENGRKGRTIKDLISTHRPYVQTPSRGGP